MRETDIEPVKDRFERGGPIVQETRPVDHRTPHSTRVGFGVEYMAQPSQAAGANAEAVAIAKRPGDLERRTDRHDHARRPADVLKYRPPEPHEAAHARILDDRNAGAAELLKQDRLGAIAQRPQVGRLDSAYVKSSPVLPSTSAGGENLLVQRNDERRLIEATRIVRRGRQEMTRGASAQPNEGARDARRAAAMHAQHDKGGRTQGCCGNALRTDGIDEQGGVSYRRRA